MPTSRPALSYDVFVAPEKLAKAPPPRVGDPPAWDPTTSTLIFGARDAVLVDALMTVREATALADWIELHDRRLTTIYITHGHGDHYSGLSVVLHRFPGARAVATAGTVQQMRNGSATAHPYRAWFPVRSLTPSRWPSPSTRAISSSRGSPSR
jgi:glyoxylase-like metal-dependent hydrolase (beta-lactamase superfamily II)